MNSNISLIYIFDPGASTGFAALATDGTVLATSVLLFDDLESFIQVLDYSLADDVEVIIEIGPRWNHHSPITKKAEVILTSAFPNAYLVGPSSWKSHPVSKEKVDKTITVHERDAVRLGKWYLATRG